MHRVVVSEATEGLLGQRLGPWSTYSCLSVLDGQLHGDPQALPVTGGLGNVVTNFLGRLERKRQEAIRLEQHVQDPDGKKNPT